MGKVYTVTLTLPNGKRKYYRGSTRKEAEDKRNKDRFILNQGINISDDTTFEEMARIWFEVGKKGNLHVRSEETIEGILYRYILPQIGDIKLKDLKLINIQMLMRSVNNYSHSTQSKVLQITKAVINSAVDNNLIFRSPIPASLKAGGSKPGEVVPLSDEQMETLFNATRGTRVYPFLVVLRFLGLRKGEALGLMWSDIDWDKQTVTVNRSIVYTNEDHSGIINPEMKTSAAHRTIPMVPSVFKLLQAEHEKSRSLYVFSMPDGRYLSEASFRRMWELIFAKKRGIDFDVHPHQLRHTCITDWIMNGMDPKTAQYLAGHSTSDMTMDIYSHYKEEERRSDTAERLARIVPDYASSL